MRMLYLTRANTVRVSEVDLSKSLIEKDGMHRIPDTCIYACASGKDRALTIMFQGRVLPYGDKQDKATIGHTCGEIIATHYLGGKMTVDSALGRLLGKLKGQGVTILLILIGLTILLSTIMEGL